MAYADVETNDDDTADEEASSVPKSVLKRARKLYELAKEDVKENHDKGRESIRFSRLGEQWPEEIRVQRELEGRPCLTENRLPTFGRQVVNDCRLNKPGIKVHPVDSGADLKTAAVFDGLIRNIEVTSEADIAYDTAVESAVDAGFGFMRVNLDWAHDDAFEKDLKILAVTNQFSVLPDPNSRSADSSDWNDCFVREMVPRDEFKHRFPKAKMVNWDASDWQDIKGDWLTSDEVMICEWWHREEVSRDIVKLSNGIVVDADWLEGTELISTMEELGGAPITNLGVLELFNVTVVAKRKARSYKVIQYVMTACEVLEKTEWPGRFIPIIPVYGEVIHLDGKRYLRSLYHNAMDSQAMYNFWLSAATEMVALQPKAPWTGPVGMFDTDRAKWDTANIDNHSTLEWDLVEGYAGGPTRQPPASMPSSMMQMLLAAADGIKSTLGMFNASLGQASNEVSGIAIHERKQEGDTSTFHFTDNLSRAIRHLGRILIDLIPHVYTGERMVRILGPDRVTAQNVQLGARPMVQQPGTAPALPVGAQHGPEQAPMTPQGQMLVPAEVYDLAVGKYDLVVETGPSFSTRRAEAASSMIELIRAFPPAASVLGDLLAKNLDWPDADTVAQRLRALLPPAAQGGGPEAQQVQGLLKQISDLTAQLQGLQGDKSSDMLKARTDAFNAETKRMEVTGDHQLQQGRLLLDAANMSHHGHGQPHMVHTI
jgi:hypothetical protein